ncbi:hypothetical protein [Actinobacillus pleuropneumoniae]|uniref:Capsular polysaccharide biosynthesis protein Cps16B n=1 Tax=Actinobacillus pleuropneumoniae TaxID=715 RepID=A0A1P8J7Y1_ACTPL|nr:hypothetical protein [Actinobacillus pleuropneumoniae]APW29087.1 capsular polysaccharide biosynthesis protein Cps16B [Actinobacillus pleuropneumoniae]AVY03747.1 capsular polysaccharide biosynthesis protein Cps16B [Actinobacillus pleuropneumoniae]UKH20698.1 hypothetical protein D1109_05970 [Actinobacillus pleuropneumoniae]UPA20443.1 hypothetical protein JS559_08920 [Actinobacillus pleuropneumoniae]
MKKIIIIGHSTSGYQSVEELFQVAGMSPALPSKRDGMTPQEIDSVLKKVIFSPSHSSKELLPAKRYQSKRQAKKIAQKFDVVQSSIVPAETLINPIWDHLALDLMLGNLDQSFWGWSNPNALDTLEYWQRIDPEIYFVFVYDNPHSVLLQYTEEEILLLDDKKITEKLDTWAKYNKKMLNAFEKFQDRSVLISSKQLIEFSENSIRTVYDQIQAPIDLESRELTLDLVRNNISSNNKYINTFLVECIINNYSDMILIYENLQESADLPYLSKMDIKNGMVLQSWKEIIKDKIFFQSQIKEKNKLLSQYKEEYSIREKFESANKVILAQLHLTQDLLEKELLIKQEMEKNSSIYRQRLDVYESDKIDLTSKLRSLENDKKELQSKLNNLENDNKNLQSILEHVENSYNNVSNNVENIRAQLTLTETENQNLILQLHLTQDELEKQYSVISSLQKPIYLGAADRIKSEMPYRLGKKMIEASKSLKGWLTMPCLLKKEANKVKEEQEKSEGLKYINIEEYADFSDAEKVKKHLSYKLGVKLLKNIRKPYLWIFIPFSLLSTIYLFRKN